MSKHDGSESVRRTGYSHPYSHYSAEYGAAERTVKRWVGKGRDVGDHCPLDDPESLRGWWGRHMLQRCPEKILAAAVAIRKEVRSLEIENPSPIEKQSSELTPRELLPVGEDEVGIAATLGRLRNAEVQANRMLVEALEAGDNGKATLAQSMWTKLTTQVRQVEKDARLDAEARGLLIPRVYAESRLVELHASIEQGMRGLYRRMCELLRVPIDVDQEAAWNDECDRLFQRFKEEVFSEK